LREELGIVIVTVAEVLDILREEESLVFLNYTLVITISFQYSVE